MHKGQLASLAFALGLSATSCQSTPPAAVATTPTAVPTRVVSLIPSATELIYEVGAESSLVGVTINDTYPPQVQALPKVGDQTIDPERRVSLKPDLVVLDTEFNADAKKYERMGMPVLALESRRLADVAVNLRLLGQRLGQTEKGEKAAREFLQALEAMPKVTNQGDVFVEIWGSPLMTVGGESLPNDLLAQVGLKNSYADQKGYFQVDPEDVVSRRPAIIILPSAKPSDKSTAAQLLARAGVPVKVIVLDGDLFTNPSPRVLEGLRLILEKLGQKSG